MAPYAKLGFGFFVAYFALDFFIRRELDGVLLWRSAIAAVVAATVLWFAAHSGSRRRPRKRDGTRGAV
jgi:hypothetical protein